MIHRFFFHLSARLGSHKCCWLFFNFLRTVPDPNDSLLITVSVVYFAEPDVPFFGKMFNALMEYYCGEDTASWVTSASVSKKGPGPLFSDSTAL